MLTERGLVPIEDVRRGEYVYTQSGRAPVAELYEMPPRELRKIVLETGLSVTVTPSQPLKVLNRELQYEWKAAEDLASDDHLVVRASYPEQLPYQRLPDWQGQPVLLDENVAYILGQFLSDGWFEEDGRRFCFYSTSQTILRRVAAALEACFDYRRGVEYLTYTAKLASGKERPGQAWQIRINSSELNRYLIAAFPELAGAKATTKRIPSQFFQSPRSVIGALLSGMLDGDGSVHVRRNCIHYGTVSERLADDTQLLSLIHI